MARIAAGTHAKLLDLAARRGESHQQVLDAALELLERRQFFEEASEAYGQLRADAPAFAALEKERAVLDGASQDQLQD